jgi:Protein of unknown function (DUF3426)
MAISLSATPENADYLARTATARALNSPRYVAERRGKNVARRAKPRIPFMVLAVGLALVAGALVKPNAVVSMLPGFAKVYAAIGMPVNLRGIDLDHVSARFEEAGGSRFLVVEGVLRSISRGTLDVPRLRMTLLDDNGRSVYSWTASAGVKALAPREAAPFRARLAAPPLESRRVTVDFVPDQSRG